MIKGVNRQMIEVTHTGSPYFERAFLVVRGGANPPPTEHLHRQAEKVVQQAGTYAGLRRQKRRAWVMRGVFALLSAGVGALCLWLTQQLVA